MSVETRRWTGPATALVLATVVALAVALTGGPVEAWRDHDSTEYKGGVEVVRGSGGSGDVLEGVVFDDRDEDSSQDRDERGLPGVPVSNGRDVVLTDARGRYALEVDDNMAVFVTKPAGWDVPVDETNFPQSFYHHAPTGSPDLRFEGLPPTGPLPTAVNFPMTRSVRTRTNDEMECAVIGDTQTYSNREISYLRDGVVEDLAARDDLDECGALLLGDLMGDDLGLYPRFKEVMAATSARATTPTTSGTSTSSGSTTCRTRAPRTRTPRAAAASAQTPRSIPTTTGSSARRS